MVAEVEAPIEQEPLVRHGRCTEVDGVRVRLYLLHWHDTDYSQETQVIVCGPADADLGALERQFECEHDGSLPSPEVFAAWLADEGRGFYVVPGDQWDTVGVGW